MPPSYSRSMRLLVASFLPVALLGLSAIPASPASAAPKRDIPKHEVLKEDKELTSLRTENSKTFRLKNGKYRTVFTAEPTPAPKVDANGMSLIASTEWIDGSPTCHINSALSTSDCSSQTMKVGKSSTSTSRSLIGFDISPIYMNVNVNYASLALYETTSTNGTSVPLRLHHGTKAWTTAATWTKATSSVNWSAAGGDFHGTPEAEEGGATYTGYHYIPATAAVRDWVSGEDGNNGLVLKTDESANNVLTFASANNSNFDRRPTLTVEYDYDTSQRDWHTTFDQQIDDRTGLTVNLGNGNLAVNALDIKAPGVGPALSISRNWSSLHKSNSREFGNGWSFGAVQARVEGTNDGVLVTLPGGSTETFLWNGSGFDTPDGMNADLIRAGSQYELTFRGSDEKWVFPDTWDGYRSYLGSVEDRNGNAITYTYDLSTTGGDDSWPVLTDITDTYGNDVTVTRNGSDQTIEIEDWTGRSTAYTITNNQLVTVTDSELEQTLYDYDSNGYLNKITTPEGRQTKMTYHGDGRVASVTRVTNVGAGTGPTWNFTYDPYVYDAPSNSWLGKTTVEDLNSNDTVYTRDTTNRITTTVDALSHARSTSWTPNNAPATITDGLSAVKNLTYDLTTNNLTEVQAPDVSPGNPGYSTTLAYSDPSHPYLPSQVTDPQGNQLAYNYDGNGNATKTTTDRATENEFDRTYNSDGTIATNEDALGNITSFGYTGQRLTSINHPSSTGDESFTYDTVGRVKTHTDGKGQTTTYAYDTLDRLVLITYNNTQTVNFTYDDDGNLTNRVDASGSYSFVYDELQRPKTKNFPGSGSSAVTYDGVGNVLTYTDAGGTVTYGYDVANNVTKLAEPGGSCTGTITKCTTFGYDDNNNRTTTTYPNGVVQTVTYDSSGRPKTMVGTKSPSTLTSLTYSYNHASNGDQSLVQKVTDNVTGRYTEYGYTDGNQLEFVGIKNSSHVDVDEWVYTYDGNGNRVTDWRMGSGTVTSAFNNAGERTSRGGTTFTYDDNSNMTASSAGFAASYNDRNQATSLKAAGGTAQSQAFADIGQHERVTSGSTTFKTGMLGLQSDTTGGTTNKYIRDPQGNLVGFNNGTTTYYYLFDNIGSVIALTNSSGAIAQSFSYDPYGQVLTSSISVDSRFKFAGGEYDTTTKLYHFGERFYEPQLGQWTQRDTYGGTFDAPVTLNRFLYVNGNPVNYVDPSGRKTCIKETVAGAAVGFGGTYLAAAGTAVGTGGAFAAPAAATVAGATLATAGTAALGCAVDNLLDIF
jgi:RHS repeat-associated protein